MGARAGCVRGRGNAARPEARDRVALPHDRTERRSAPALRRGRLLSDPPRGIRRRRRRASIAWGLALVAFGVVATRLGLKHVIGLPFLTTGQNVGQHLLYGAVAFFLILPAVFGGVGGGRRSHGGSRWLRSGSWQRGSA